MKNVLICGIYYVFTFAKQMCGIFCTFAERNCPQCLLLKNHNLCRKTINNRGPDFERNLSLNLNDLQFIFAVSVLWLQGRNLTEQPLQNNNGIFIYNGDIFDYTRGICEIDPLESDTETLMRFIENVGVYDAFSVCNGPFSFIYLHTQSSKLYFGRDHYGRRSLLIGKLENTFIITSTAKRMSNWEFIELPPLGIFSYDLNTKVFELTIWEEKSENFERKLKEVEAFLNSSVNITNQYNRKKKINFRLPRKEELDIFEHIKSKDLENNIKFLFSLEQWFSNISVLEGLLKEAVRKRVHIQPKKCSNCIFKNSCYHSLTGVLFSGGIDCAILALLCDKFSSKERPIDLINVAFSKTNNFNTPDRATGLSTLEELKELCPDRKWNFVEINISEEELNEKRNQVIADLIYPLNTILDDSLGCALWFAARGENSTYKSTCRVLLVGMGADELFGGYKKHRNALKAEGWPGLFKSLEDDWQNLPHRNLARDDRVVSDHGRQLRTPYLDENVVNFVRNLNCWERTYPMNDVLEGFGEKILLRCLAYKLGFRKAAFLRKRALQFGSRIANSKENAKDVSARLLLS